MQILPSNLHTNPAVSGTFDYLDAILHTQVDLNVKILRGFAKTSLGNLQLEVFFCGASLQEDFLEPQKRKSNQIH